MSVQCLIITVIQVLTIQLLTAKATHGQNLKTTRLSLEVSNAKIVEIFKLIEKRTDYKFVYPDDVKHSKKEISLSADNESLERILISVGKETNLKFRAVKHTITATFGQSRQPAGPDIRAQDVSSPVPVTGRVTDMTAGPLPGVNVLIKGTAVGTTTDSNGEYAIEVPASESVLVFSFIGYQTKEILVGNQTVINVELDPDVKSLQEIVVVGYGEKSKITLTGAVSSISSEDIVTTKNENIQNALTGKLPGVRVVQKTSEPGVFSNDFDIRGFGTPLIVIDGIPRDNIARLDPNDIESISVLKDASAAVYGVRAANGVVLITTKKGKDGKLELNYSGTYGVQRPSGLPNTVDAADWLTLVNEKYMRTQGITNVAPPPHTQEEIETYRNGSKQSIDWYPHVIQETAPQFQHNLSASGGTETVNYFISLGYLTQEGFFKSGDLNYERYNVRSNITARIANNITANLQISGILDERNQPFIGTWEVFKALWRQDPIDPMYANNNPAYLGRMQSGTNAIALSSAEISGYQKNQNKWIQSSFSLSYNFPFVTGLTAKGMVSYDYRTQNDKSYQKEYALYTYDESTGTYQAFNANSPSAVRRSFSENPASLLQASLDYTRSFNDVHNVGALVLYEEQTRSGDNFFARRELALTGLDELFGGSALNQQGSMNANGIYKLANKGLVGRVNYDYGSKYIAEFSFRYDGSSKFPKDKQWGFFPAASLGWRISEENFFRNAQFVGFINDLKLRGSYGVMGDDGASAYQFITGYTYPAPKGGNNQGLQGGSVFDGSFVSAIDFKNLVNPNITWFEVETLNLGLDAQLLRGLVNIQFDVFRRNREGLLATRRLSLPGSLGAALPEENMNSDQVKGFEIVLGHRNRIGALGYNVSGNFSMTRTRWLDYDKAEAVNSYDYWRSQSTSDPFVRQPNSNRYNDILWGYEVIGQFQSYEEIYNSDVYYGPNTLPGDFKYLDWNKDGVIDDNDIHPIANNNATPKMYFGLSAGVNYKNFDLNVLFQGASLVNVAYPEQLAAPLAWDGSALDYFLDRWHPVDPMANPYDPNTEWIGGKYPYTGGTALPQSTFHLQDASYLRLKSLEIGYSLPGLKGIKSARIYASGYNLITWSGIKYVDPEHPSETYGYIYPLNKTYNIGVNVTF